MKSYSAFKLLSPVLLLLLLLSPPRPSQATEDIRCIVTIKNKLGKAVFLYVKEGETPLPPEMLSAEVKKPGGLGSITKVDVLWTLKSDQLVKCKISMSKDADPTTTYYCFWNLKGFDADEIQKLPVLVRGTIPEEYVQNGEVYDIDHDLKLIRVILDPGVLVLVCSV